MIHSHNSADAVRRGQRHPLRHRPFGKRRAPFFNQHYIGTMDYWDPMVTDGLLNREVIPFNNAAAFPSSGEVLTTFERWSQRHRLPGAGLKQVRSADRRPSRRRSLQGA
jgi:hypothetical protein